MARQPLGQHFLISEAWRERIRSELAPPATVPWVEIGAGRGEMTRELALDGIRVVAIETDARLIPFLRALSIPGVEIIHGDVLDADLAALVGGPFRVYGNLPYYITSPILHRLLGVFAANIRDIHIVVQREVAARIVATPGGRDYGYLSSFCQFYARPEILFSIPPGAFQPPPKVESALLRLTLPGEGAALGLDAETSTKLLGWLKICFAQKRKTLRNNLRGHAGAKQIANAFAAAEIDPDARAEQLTLPQMADLFKALGLPGAEFRAPRPAGARPSLDL